MKRERDEVNVSRQPAVFPVHDPMPQINNPFSVIDWAARSVASAGWLRPAFALIVVAGASIKLFPSPGIAVFATLSLLITMVLFYVFSQMVARDGGRDELPARIMLWMSLGVFIGAIGLVASLATARQPTFLADLLGLRERSIALNDGDQAQKIKILKQSNLLPENMIVTADMYDSPNKMEAFIVNASAYYCPAHPDNRDICVRYAGAAQTVEAARPTQMIPSNLLCGSNGTCNRLIVNSLGPSDPVLGLDISHINATTDFQRFAAQGVSFVLIKASQGNSGIDPEFVRNWDAAGEAGLARGAYHVFSGDFSPQQAANFSAVLKRVTIGPCDLGAALDIADSLYLQGRLEDQKFDLAKYLDGALAWLHVTEQWTGKAPLVYYGSGNFAAFERFPEKLKALNQYPLWWAQFSPVPRRSDYVLWQYSDGVAGRSALPFANDHVDQSVFNGGRAKFLDFLRR